ncbi:NAD(P)/FAD-dependent oxidoreductase [Geomesophilobacter sediminis]|uniref:NAD(P)/FAD-dependent oxidoreductase n=1 Tax=Geomesophilobacter sediminis TaxID=2798584 RepID=A0A8J7IMR8_9BACT|nr:NAD(P)/FAD-dependent oxidoreductase [Geomesophilobacter sediminis]MBJ6723094.1 NAD(P)/FAD-dependent oxidoreductase [Geomesophilobacter sediminis]
MSKNKADAKSAIIIGAGPAGLTAAYELLDRTSIVPLVFEATNDIGGISKTVVYKGNRIDIGGHRFFSKSSRVMAWWQNLFPLQGAPARDDRILGRQVPLATSCRQRAIGAVAPETVPAPDPETDDVVMLVRSRLSRIFFLRKFFNYPISLTWDTIANLGALRILKIGLSYLRVQLAPRRTEASLEDFFVNRFGRELYGTFFQDYTEKVWGVPCREIKPEWGAQRIKGLSVTKTVLHALQKLLPSPGDAGPKKVETSLIEEFHYPKLGPGQMWETAAERIRANGGSVVLNRQVVGIETDRTRVTAVLVRNEETGEISRHGADYFFSTMPVRELITAMGDCNEEEVKKVAAGLVYRDFITVGLLLKKLAIKNETKLKTVNDLVPDNWIYIQERDVKLGRLQVFNNWSPYLVQDPDTVWIGLEYFCNEGDELWTMSDEDFSRFAIDELASIDIIDHRDVLDWTVLRMPKAYPAYFGSYDDFDVVRGYVDRFENLFLIGRNGMHRYNNADHSMLTAMTAVDNIIAGKTDKGNIWAVNAEEDYHESK